LGKDTPDFSSLTFYKNKQRVNSLAKHFIEFVNLPLGVDVELVCPFLGDKNPIRRFFDSELKQAVTVNIGRLGFKEI
jgi:hypothetical protein